MADQEGCPIQSNIQSTAGNDNDDDKVHTYPAPAPQEAVMDISEENFYDPDDAVFDAEDGDPLMDDDAGGWGSIHSSDDQQQVCKQREKDIVMIGANEENPFAEGDESVKVIENRPLLGKGDPKQKCWICDVCHAINNLLESMQKYDCKCCLCSYAYHPKVAIIFSHDWDGKHEEDSNEEIFTVWTCSICTYKNNMSWTQCEGCQYQRPKKDQLIISYSYMKPKQIDNYNNKKHNNNNYNFAPFLANQGQIQNLHEAQNKAVARKQPRHKLVRKPRIGNIGIPRNLTEYPAKSVVNDMLEKRLMNIFGAPYRNKRLLDNYVHHKSKWSQHCDVLHSRIEWKSRPNFNDPTHKQYTHEEIVGRGFAINARSGWIASMSCDHIWVFAPSGSTTFTLMATYIFSEQQRLSGQDVANSRIRFVSENAIFVWSFSRSRVYSFKLYENSLILLDVIKDKYFKDSQTMDVAVCNDLLILLFDRWCGVYRLYPKFQWYHAVAFATKSVNCFSLEIVEYDGEEVESKENEEDTLYKSTNRQYLFINTEDQIIAIHPTNPTFDFLHIAKDAKHAKCKYTVSKQYGVFYIANDGLSLYQSSNLEVATNHTLIDLNSKENEKEKEERKNKKKGFCGIEPFHDIILQYGIERFCNVVYDEMYGISGRLLVYCQTKKKEFVIHQFVNQNELQIFYDELSRMQDYYVQLIPGMANEKAFNLIIYVYQMLFGDDLIHTLIHTNSDQKHSTMQPQDIDPNQLEGLI